MLLERIKLFFAKSKIVKLIFLLVLIVVCLYFAIQMYYCFYGRISETTKGIVGTLLGALVGGCFTLAGSLAINKNAQKAVNAIKRKNIIYKPLYDELMEIHSEILEENPYPHFIVFEKGQQTMLKHPQYTVWGRIKKDARIFEVPAKLKKAMEELYKALESYQEKRGKAVVALDRIYREELKKVSNRTIADQANVGDSLLSYVLSGDRPDDGHLMWSFGSEKCEGADALWENLRKKTTIDTDLKSCIDAKSAWNKSEENVLKLLGIFIQYITTKYEG